MNSVASTASTVIRGFRALPFVLRRLVLVLVYSLIFAAGAFEQPVDHVEARTFGEVRCPL